MEDGVFNTVQNFAPDLYLWVLSPVDKFIESAVFMHARYLLYLFICLRLYSLACFYVIDIIGLNAMESFTIEKDDAHHEKLQCHFKTLAKFNS